MCAVETHNAPSILYLEDSLNDIEFLKARLEAENFRCTLVTARRRAEFENAITKQRFDLLSDYSLPDYDGLTALDLITAQSPTTPFIFFSGQFGEELAVEGLRRGAVDYILKSRSDRLIPSLRRALVEAQTKKLTQETLQALKVSERRYRSFLSATSAITWTCDPDGLKVADASGWCEYTGQSAEEFQTRGWLDAVHPDDQTPTTKSWKQAVQDRQVYSIECRLRRFDGVYRHFQIRAVPLLCDNGELEGWTGACNDVTERVESQHVNSLLAGIVKSSSDPIVGTTLSGTVTSWNPAAELTFGYVADEIIGNSISHLIPPEHLDSELFVSERVREGQAISHYESARVTKSGKLLDVSVSVFPVRDKSHSIAGISTIIRDITEQKRAREALAASEERFRELAENIHEAFWMTDPTKGAVLYISPAYEKIWGRPCETLYDNSAQWLESVHPEDRAHVREAAFTRQASGEYDESYRIIRPDGTIRWIRDCAFPVKDKNGQVYRIVGTAQDITTNRLLEQQLRQAQKMEAIGTLAGGIAHDFNNILGAINGFTELAKLSLNDPHKLSEYLGEIAHSGWRAAALVKQILTFSRAHEQTRHATDVAKIILETQKLLRATLPSTITLTTNIQPNTPHILADPNQIHQIVMNLCTNAWHAIRDGGQEHGGQLSVNLHKFTVDDIFAKSCPQLRRGEYVRLIVADNGVGMDRATTERIFEPFFTTKAPGEGTGLGLSVVHGIVKAHDGVVIVESRPGIGTTFYLYFPAVDPALDLRAAESAPAPNGAGEQILLVEDEELLGMIGKTMLERLNYKVDVELHATEALEKARRAPQRYQLAILDLTMPELSGFELARELKRLNPRLPIILTTGYAEGLTPDNLANLGIDELLPKPYSFDALGCTVGRVLTNAITQEVNSGEDSTRRRRCDL